VLAALTVAVVRTTPLPVDEAVHGWVLAHRNPGVVRVAIAITATGSGLPAYLLAAGAGAIAYRGRWWVGAPLAVLALLAGQGVRAAFAEWVDRPRPPRADWAAGATGDAFPSGHTTTSALVAALLCAALAGRLQGRRLRATQAVVVGWAALVGVTRVYLGVHWPTDVIGGWLLATVLTLLAAALVRGVGPRLPVGWLPPRQDAPSGTSAGSSPSSIGSSPNEDTSP
jgi:undecaprenyl-diphosphatase